MCEFTPVIVATVLVLMHNTLLVPPMHDISTLSGCLTWSVQGLANASVTVCVGARSSQKCSVTTVLESTDSSVAFVLPGSTDEPAVATRFRACGGASPTSCTPDIEINTANVWWVQGDDSISTSPRATQGGWIKVYVSLSIDLDPRVKTCCSFSLLLIRIDVLLNTNNKNSRDQGHTMYCTSSLVCNP